MSPQTVWLSREWPPVQMESWKVVPGGMCSKGVWVVILWGCSFVPGGKIRFRRKSIEFSSSGFHLRLLSGFVDSSLEVEERVHVWICAADVFGC